MTDRLVDPTRQGVPSHEPELPSDWAGRAKPIALKDALAMVDSWESDFAPFQLHQLARSLRRGVEEAEQRYADLAERGAEAYEEEQARLGNLRRENEALRRELDSLEADACNDASEIDAHRDHIRSLQEQRALLAEERDSLKTEIGSLRFRAAQSGVALVDQPDMYGTSIEHFPLERVLDLMKSWRPEVERWGLHQMCRVLRAEYDQAMGRARQFSDAWDRTEIEAYRWFMRWQKHDSARKRSLDAVPCTAGLPDGGGLSCHAPYYRHQPCCNLRVALWPGEPVETDHLPDSGDIHLFQTGRGRDQVRASAGCVKLVEPTVYERNETLDWDRRAG
jgi:hypothetical protein